MDALYPNLVERFKNEGLCPICLLEMQLEPGYICSNGHNICHRCKPFYYGCPTCQSPLDIQFPSPPMNPPYPPPPTHFMPHPMPPQYHGQYPSAPPVDDFYRHERQAWYPPSPSEDQELIPCCYSHLGCWVKVPEYLKDLHQSRCQFRPHLEEEHLPTDLNQREDDLVECTYQPAGCNVKTPLWRISIHENYCIYKDVFDTVHDINESLQHVTITNDDYGDPEELVECRYRRYGCMVNMPRRRKQIHELKCNYSKYRGNDEEEYDIPSYSEYDPDEQVSCKWAEYGCRVKPKRSRQESHEEKCNYRREECAFKYFGCDAMLQPSRKYAHERSCQFAN